LPRLVVSPDATAYGTVKALLQHPNPDWSPIAVVTTGPADAGQTLMGVPVLGSATNLRRWIRYTEAQGVAFVQGGASSDRVQVRRLYAECLAAHLPDPGPAGAAAPQGPRRRRASPRSRQPQTKGTLKACLSM